MRSLAWMLLVSRREAFLRDGWCDLPVSDALAPWLDVARSHIPSLIEGAPETDWRAGRTWFAGVSLLGNSADAAMPGGPPLPGVLTDMIRAISGFGVSHWDAGQLSICREGYPKPDVGESEAAARYRRTRDAAHVDGLHRIGTSHRRFLREHHAFILGIPVTDMHAGNAPLVVWEGSQHMIRTGLALKLGGSTPDRWPELDVTDAYQAARREIFDRATRRVLTAQAGHPFLVHRLALHGIAPWTGPAGTVRTVIYFRPEIPSDAKDASWLDAT